MSGRKIYRAEFRARHKKTRKAMRRADKAAAIAVEALHPPTVVKAPPATREARRRLRQKTRLELKKLEEDQK